jgi:hypothetical protein
MAKDLGNEACQYAYTIKLMNFGDNSSLSIIKDKISNQCAGQSFWLDIKEVSDSSLVFTQNDDSWQYSI